MAEYIDRENYCENICRCSNEYCYRISCPIWKAPAADVVPVVHGRWLRADDFVICSRCEAEMNQKNSLGVDNFKNFCPNCGAIMDGDSDG